MRGFVTAGVVIALGLAIGGNGGGQYHCSIHPVMVGSINQDTSSSSPCQGPYCP
jgi:hypothetical protein